MNLFEHSLKSSMEELEEALSNAKSDLNNVDLQKKLNYRLGSSLHWIIDYWERAEKLHKDIPNEIIAFFSALRFANNQLKHEITLTRLYQRTGGFCFPISFPLVIPRIQFVWALNPNNQARYTNQIANYKQYLENRDVMKTITDAVEILEGYKLS